jgi:uncharacterized protein YcaQ
MHPSADTPTISRLPSAARSSKTGSATLRRAEVAVSKADARRIWLHAQRLDRREPFGRGAEATRIAVEHLGYVQIDTINVVERSHHHILWTRIPEYRSAHLHQAQSIDKAVFEYWTHALSYVPTRDLRFFLPEMMRQRRMPRMPWNRTVTDEDLDKVLTRLRENGPLTIRDIDDDVLVEKDWAWASRKPSKRALEMQFSRGVVTISQRTGMVKTYDLIERHFGWDTLPRPATERQILDYRLDRALRSQGLVSLDSVCYHAPRSKPAMRALIEARVRRKVLVPITLEGAGKTEHWAEPRALEAAASSAEPLVHILSPFDPLIIQRKRLKLFFDYDHRFEAYLPKEKRVFGYFVLPVLVGDEIVAALDLKTDRQNCSLLVQRWNWVGKGEAGSHKMLVEEALNRFERFQLQD